MGADDIHDIPFVIIDSVACVSVVGKQTMNDAMKKLRINKL